MINIITISREFGSGGRTIASILADKLGYSFYDKELIARAAERTGFAESFVQEHGEKLGSRFFSIPYGSNTFNGMTTEDYLWSMQRKIILELAEEGPCVIVGRCSDYILKDREDAFHVFIHADPADRAERIINQYGVKTQDPAKAVADEDKNRRRNYRYYTDREWGAVNNYTVSLNSSVFGIEGTADMILTMVRSLNELPGQEMNEITI